MERSFWEGVKVTGVNTKGDALLLSIAFWCG